MGWIYLAELADSQKPSKDTSSPSPTVKTTDTLKLFYSTVWPMDLSLLLLSQTTSGHWREIHYPCPSISSTEASPAKTLAWRDAELVWKESEVDYFSRSSGCAARYDPDSSSWRTSQRLLFEEQNELLESFAAYGMTVDGAFYPLRMWERRIYENDGSCWPTLQATQRGTRGKDLVIDRKSIRRRGSGERRGMDLSMLLGGNPNPEWAEWFMGYALKWTALEDWAMRWFRPRRGKRLKD
jgi:hypothetical protein